MHTAIPHDTPVYRTADIRAIEARHADESLMERAGLSAAQLARELAGGNGQPILIYAGPGNNGGDAFVVARHLKTWWFNVTVVFNADETKLSADAAAALRAFRAAGGVTVNAAPTDIDWALVIDGLFGIGLTRDIGGEYAAAIDAINAQSAPVLAVDIPSGLEADSGRVLGRAVRAAHTMTFIGLKSGLLTLDGPDHCGQLHVDHLGLDPSAGKLAPGAILSDDVLDGLLASRARNTHKGSHGSVGIIGGAPGMVGAALLAGRAALKLGAGRVYAGLIAENAPPVDTMQPELMLRSAHDIFKLDHLTALAIGPGLGLSPDAAHYVKRALESPLPLVIDADGLNLIALDDNKKTVLKQRVMNTLLTPHPAEAARLLGCTTQAVQFDRVAAVLRIASELNCHVLLKGTGSVCASPGKPWRINTSGNPGMASAGMGDVLTGILAALLAQGADAAHALDAAVWLHGAAADACVAEGIGPVGLAASETTDAARRLLNGHITQRSAGKTTTRNS